MHVHSCECVCGGGVNILSPTSFSLSLARLLSTHLMQTKSQTVMQTKSQTVLYYDSQMLHPSFIVTIIRAIYSSHIWCQDQREVDRKKGKPVIHRAHRRIVELRHFGQQTV